MFLRWVRLLSPIFIIISFFLPWISIPNLAVSGLQVSLMVQELEQIFVAIDLTASIPTGTEILLTSLWAIPILSVLSTVLLILDKSNKLINGLLSVYSIGVFIYLWTQMNFSSLLLSILDVGLYMLLLFSFLLLISTFFDREEYLHDDEEEE